MAVRLVRPQNTEHYELELYDILEEFAAAEETVIPYGLHYGEATFQAILARTRAFEEGRDLPAHLVVSTTWWLVREEDDRILGASNIRHTLNDSLLETGGHIGYGIRPSERRKGYATRLLALSLEKCAALGIEKALVTCDKDNIASARTILANGGVLEDERLENGVPVQRYWVPTRKEGAPGAAR